MKKEAGITFLSIEVSSENVCILAGR